MISLHFAKAELSAALARGVRQCVLIGPTPPLRDALESSIDPGVQLFAVDKPQSDAEALAASLQQFEFDHLKATVFVWLGSAGYRTVDGVLSALVYIASLPKGSSVLLDYVTERTSLGSFRQTALDALASRICTAGGNVKLLIQPQAVAAMLRGAGFQKVVDRIVDDLATDELTLNGSHLVSAMV